MNIDLHVHCDERSACGRSSEEEQIEAAIEASLDALVFTDHDRLVPEKRLTDLNARYAPFRVFGGIEVSVEGEHVLVIGPQDRALETREWEYPELHGFVRAEGGFMALAHPFRYRDNITINVYEHLPDALEIASINIREELTPVIHALADNLGVRLVSNSDGHAWHHLGKHFNILHREPRDEQELAQILQAGEYQIRSGLPSRGMDS